MVVNLDYNNEDVMKILNNPNYSDGEKKDFYNRYIENTKENRKNEIINKLNEYAKNNPIITQEEYIGMLKKYQDDDLTKPFDTIKEELNDFNRKMGLKLEEYKSKKMEEERRKAEAVKPEPAPIPEPVLEEKEPEPDIEIDNTNPNLNFDIDIDDIKPDVTPYSKTNLEPTVFETNSVKEVNSKEIPESNENKGSASAIIISIIAIIVGMVIMYSIIRLK